MPAKLHRAGSFKKMGSTMAEIDGQGKTL